MRVLLSSYSQAINKQEMRKGSLFTQNTRAKSLNDEPNNEYYEFICFQYIHQNPIRAGLVDRLEDWKYSSFNYYIGRVKGNICNIELAKEIINFDTDNFYEQAYAVIDQKKLKGIW
jgi:hypothetical protein